MVCSHKSACLCTSVRFRSFVHLKRVTCAWLPCTSTPVAVGRWWSSFKTLTTIMPGVCVYIYIYIYLYTHNIHYIYNMLMVYIYIYIHTFIHIWHPKVHRCCDVEVFAPGPGVSGLSVLCRTAQGAAEAAGRRACWVAGGFHKWGYHGWFIYRKIHLMSTPD